MLFGLGVAAAVAAGFELAQPPRASVPASQHASAEAPAKPQAAQVTQNVGIEPRASDGRETLNDGNNITRRVEVRSACAHSGSDCAAEAPAAARSRPGLPRAANERPAIAGVLVGREGSPAPAATWPDVAPVLGSSSSSKSPSESTISHARGENPPPTDRPVARQASPAKSRAHVVQRGDGERGRRAGDDGADRATRHAEDRTGRNGRAYARDSSSPAPRFWAWSW
jgi:hypothetical protein